MIPTGTEPIALALVALLVLHAHGEVAISRDHGERRGARGFEAQRVGLDRLRAERRECWVFRTGVLAAIAALVSPLGSFADGDLLSRALLEIILAWLSAPLIVLGAPWRYLARGLRLRSRSPGTARTWHTANAAHRGGKLLPVSALGVVLVFWLWHLPVLANASVGSVGIETADYASYLLAGVLCWLQLVGSHPFSPRWNPLQRIGLVVAVLAGNWSLSAAMVYSVSNWYPAFDRPPRHVLAPTISQELAGAVMWALPSIALGIFTIWAFMTWLRNDEDEEWNVKELALPLIGGPGRGRPERAAGNGRPPNTQPGGIGDASFRT